MRNAFCNLFVLLLLLVASISAATESALTPWTVQDSIAVRYVMSDGAYWAASDKDAIHFSPDGKRFFFVTKRGDLSCDCNVFGIEAFAVADVRKELARSNREPGTRIKPQASASFRSQVSFERGGIEDIRWLNSETIIFKGKEANDRAAGIYRLNVTSGVFGRVTSAEEDVFAFDMAGESVVFATRTLKELASLDEYPAVNLTPENLSGGSFSTEVSHYTIYASYKGAPARAVMRARILGLGYSKKVWLSPDGLWAVLDCAPEDDPLPQAWSAYAAWAEAGKTGEGLAGQIKATRFLLLDVKRGTVQAMLDAPVGLATGGGSRVKMTRVHWSPDSRRMILENAALPLDAAHPERRNTSYIVDYEVASGRWLPIQTYAVDGIHPPEKGRNILAVNWLNLNQLVVSHAGGLVDYRDENGVQVPIAFPDSTVYRLKGGRWTPQRERVSVMLGQNGSLAPPDPLRSEAEISISVRQSINEAPVVIASDGRRKAPLMGRDEVMERVRHTPVETVQWTESGGHVSKGLLVLPSKTPGTSPPPLVIQTRGFLPTLFRPDGDCPTGFAAQALAAQGFAVLTMSMPSEDRDSRFKAGPREGPAVVERIDAVVDSLAKQGLIDRERVGLIGHSRSGYIVYYTITNPGQTRISAAIINDSHTGSYFEYVRSNVGRIDTAAGKISDDNFEKLYAGGGSFWSNKSEWIQRAPSFNVDRVTAATLFSFNAQTGPRARIPDMVTEAMAAFRINRVPFEYLLFPDGAHNLQRPRERLASLNATVDWFGFWLLDKDDPDESKKEQYERWRKLRTGWQETQNASKKQE